MDKNPRVIDVDLVSGAPETEFSKDFLQGMLDRMGFGYFNYGPIKDGFPFDVSALDSLKKRLEKYEETKNTEFLMDAANFAMIEFMLPSLEGAFFAPTDREESPGRVGTTGVETDEPNGSKKFW